MTFSANIIHHSLVPWQDVLGHYAQISGPCFILFFVVLSQPRLFSTYFIFFLLYPLHIAFLNAFLPLSRSSFSFSSSLPNVPSRRTLRWIFQIRPAPSSSSSFDPFSRVTICIMTSFFKASILLYRETLKENLML